MSTLLQGSQGSITAASHSQGTPGSQGQAGICFTVKQTPLHPSRGCFCPAPTCPKGAFCTSLLSDHSSEHIPGLAGHWEGGTQSPPNNSQAAHFGVTSKPQPAAAPQRDGTWGGLKRCPPPGSHSTDTGQGSHLLAGFDRGPSAGGIPARGAFAHPLEHVGRVPAAVPGSAGSWWALVPGSAPWGWKDGTQGGTVGGEVKSSSREAPPRTQVSSSSSRDGGASEKKKKMTRKTSLGWKEQSPRGRTGDLALAPRVFGLTQPSSSSPAEGQGALCREEKPGNATCSH